MKTFYKLLSVAAVFLSLASCSKMNNDDFTEYFNATCTFKPQADGSYYIWVDDDLALRVTNKNAGKYPFTEGKEKRAVISYMVDKDSEVQPVEGFKSTIGAKVMSIDTIKINDPVVYDPAKESEYGNDPVGLYIGENLFPRTLVEDGYLNLCFSIPFNLGTTLHDVILLTGVNPEDPYEVEIRHNGHSDIGIYDAAHISNFRLKNLPSTEGKTVKLTLKWNSMVTGKMESVKFDYRSREDW